MIRNPLRLFVFINLIDVIGFIVAAIFIIPNLKTDPAAKWALLIYFGAVIFVAGIVWMFMGDMIKQQKIAEKGEKARATLLECWDTGTTINDNPQVGMLLEVHPSLMSPYQAKTKAVISRLAIGMLRPGVEAVVVYDPQKPENVAFVGFVQSEEEPAEVTAGRSTTDEIKETRLAELNDLHARRFISDADYQKRRNEILGGG